MDFPHLAGAKAQGRIVALARDQLGRGHGDLEVEGDVAAEQGRDVGVARGLVQRGQRSSAVGGTALAVGLSLALIPLLMYPAAQESLPGVLLVTTVFGVVTVLTMLAAVWLTLVGLDRLRLPAFERYAHALAGGAVLTCGLAIAFLGL